jgi:hypothetical protein
VRRAQTVLVAVVLTVLGSCGGGDESVEPPARTTPPETSPRPPGSEDGRWSSRTRGVLLTLERRRGGPGSVMELTIENRGDERLEFGVAYRLERRTEGGWRWLNRDAAFILILKVIPPGEREIEQITLPRDLSPGRYRIVKSFSVAGDRRFDAAVGFSVRGQTL